MSAGPGSGTPAIVHHLPGDDVIDHEATERCICGPYRESLGFRPTGEHGGRHVMALVHPRLALRGDDEGGTGDEDEPGVE